jgi:hypothetical protein
MEKLVFSLESVRTVSRNEDLQSRISQKVSGFARVVDIEASFGMLSVRPRGRAHRETDIKSSLPGPKSSSGTRKSSFTNQRPQNHLR